mgnify:CR=1 FL=1
MGSRVLRLDRFGLLTLVGCSTLLSRSTPADQPGAPPRSVPAVRHLVLVALDGVRHQEIFAGVDPERARLARIPIADRVELMPHLWALAGRGVALGASPGEAFALSGPNFVSLPGYAEMLSGKPASCQENTCPGPPSGKTLVDAVCDAAGADACGAAVITSWPDIERVVAMDPDPAWVSTGREGGSSRASSSDDPELVALLGRGRRAAPTPGHGGYRPDAETARLAVAYLAREAPRFAFIGLGDTDELAHADDYAGYVSALAAADEVIGELSEVASRWEARDEPTVIVVTTDHGRAHNFRDHGGAHPESGRSWLVAAGTGIPRRGEVRLSRTRLMRDLAPTLASMLGVAFSPPSDDGLLTELLPLP